MPTLRVQGGRITLPKAQRRSPVPGIVTDKGAVADDVLTIDSDGFPVWVPAPGGKSETHILLMPLTTGITN